MMASTPSKQQVELHERTMKKNDVVKFHTACCIVLSTVSAMLMGYDIGILSGAILFIKEQMHLSVVREEFVVGSLNLVAAGGALMAGGVANRLGRRRTLMVAAFVFFAGAAILGAAPDFAALMAGRVLTGIGVGFAMMIAPLYSAEISPASVRGFLVSFTEVFVNVGILLGYLVGFALQFLSGAYNWRLMLGLGALPAVVLFLGAVLVLPESPRWLILQNRPDDAMKVLVTAVCNDDAAEAKLRLAEIMEANELEGASEYSNIPFRRLCSWRGSPNIGVYTRMYVVAMGVNFFQQASGIDATVYYSPVVFKQAGVTSKMGMLGATAGVGCMKLAFVFVATFLLDRAGRRKLLLVSAWGIIACLTVVSVTFVKLGLNSAQGDSLLSAGDKSGTARTSSVGVAITVVAICAYVAFFSVGYGPITYVLTSEIFPLKQRATAVGLSMFVNRAVSGTVALTFLSIARAITPAGTFGLFAGLTLLSVLFILLLVPETKGKTLEEIGRFFSGPACSSANTPSDLEMQPAAKEAS